MSSFKSPKTFENYFVFFENKTKPLTRFLQFLMIAGLGINFVVAILLGLGIIKPPHKKVASVSTPVPAPPHVFENNTLSEQTADQTPNPSIRP